MRSRLIILFALFSSYIYSDSIPQNTYQILSYFENLNKKFFEKIFIHTDKTNYAAGGNIFFKVYLVNSMTQQEDFSSNYVNIELLNSDKELVITKKIKRKVQKKKKK